jgi:hypothetical protein
MNAFDEFWLAYPRKVGKAEAQIAYKKALRGELKMQRELNMGPASSEEILAGLELYKRDKPERQDWRHPTTFLNKASWIDEGGSDTVECDSQSMDLRFKQREHETGQAMHPQLAQTHGWADFGSARKLRLV